MHGQQFGPIQNQDALLVIKSSSMQIATKRVPLAHLNQTKGQNLARAFLISEIKSEYLKINSNTGVLLISGRLSMTLRVSLPTVGTFLSLVRIPGARLTRSPSQSSLQMTGQSLELTGPQPAARASQKVSLTATKLLQILNPAYVLPEEEEEQEGTEDLKLKKDLDELADEEVCFTYENREEEGILKRNGDTLEFLNTSTLPRALEENEIQRVFDWKLKEQPVYYLFVGVGRLSAPNEAPRPIPQPS
jgi:hypothetical protein